MECVAYLLDGLCFGWKITIRGIANQATAGADSKYNFSQVGSKRDNSINPFG